MKSFFWAFCLILLPSLVHAEIKRLRAIWRDDPATTMTIAWDQIEGNNPILYYDLEKFDQATEDYAFSQKPDRVVQSRGMNNHFVRLTNLRPDTKYFFIIRHSKGTSRPFWFRTAPNHANHRLSIIAGGDSRNHRQGRQNANLLVAKLRPLCVLFGGDMTAMDIASEWKDWFDDWQLTVSTDGRLTPIIPARGNHERSNKTLTDLFDVPNPDVYYALTIGGDLLRTYTLNTLIPTDGNQKTWLESDLQRHRTVAWKIAQYHHPMRPHTSKKPENQHIYQSWATLFYENQVQLVVECDAHVCKTTWGVRPTYAKGNDMGFVRDDAAGTVYVGEGCWGAPLRPADDDKSWTRASGSFNQFKWIFLDNQTMEIRTVKTDNAAQVEALSESDPFKIPKNLQIWTPKTGAVVTIQRSPLPTAAKINPPSSTAVKPTPKPAEKVATKPQKALPPPQPEQQHPKPTVQPNPKPARKPTSANWSVFNITFKLEKTNVQATWETTAEPASVVATLERSFNGEDFHPVVHLQLLGNTDRVQRYSLTDTKALQLGVPFVFYRLQHTFADGTTTHSRHHFIRLETNPTYPEIRTDAATDAAFIAFELASDSDVRLQLFDERGELVKNETYLRQLAGKQLKKWELSSLKTGKYTLLIESNDRLEYRILIR